jgi:hypothetical protein
VASQLTRVGFLYLELTVGKTEELKHATFPEFKKVIQQIWANIPEHVVRAACDAFDKRQRLIIKDKGQSIE